MVRGTLSHLIGFDDAPFDLNSRGEVPVIGTVYAGERLEGVVSTRVRRDGANASQRLIDLLTASRFHSQLQLILLQGIAFGGFNVVDIHRLHQESGLGVITVARRAPDYEAIRSALLQNVPGGLRKWRLIEKAGIMEPACGLYIQRAGIDLDAARRVLTRSIRHGKLPEPLRTAHLIAAGVVTGESRHRA